MWKILHDLYGYRIAWNGYEFITWDSDEGTLREGRLDEYQLAQVSICIHVCHAELEYRTKSKTKAIKYLKALEVLS